MATEGERRQWRDAVDDVLDVREGAERYEHRREMRRGSARADDGPRPLEFDEGDFPIPQAIPRFVQRVGRLIYG